MSLQTYRQLPDIEYGTPTNMKICIDVIEMDNFDVGPIGSIEPFPYCNYDCWYKGSWLLTVIYFICILFYYVTKV